MDNVLVDFPSGIARISDAQRKEFDGRLDEVPGIFSLMEPIEGAVIAFDKLADKFDTYILSTAPWENDTAWSDKLIWVKKYLGAKAHKRLILSHHKNLNKGDYLIDDRPLHNGANYFAGKVIPFGSDDYPDWDSVASYLMNK